LLVNAVEAGADKVDVAIGELSGGPSHSNMREVIYEALGRRGFSPDEIKAHPVMQQLAVVEKTIDGIVRRRDPDTGRSFDDARGPLRELSPEDIERYRIAGGSFSDFLDRAHSQFPKDPENERRLFRAALDEGALLWEQGGRFNTVTPGAKILAGQAYSSLNIKKAGHMPKFGDYSPEYLNVITGRLGENRGMEKSIDGADTGLRDTALMYRTLKVLNTALLNGEIPKEAVSGQPYSMLTRAELGESGNRLKINENGSIDLLNVDQVGSILAAHVAGEQKTPLERLKGAVAKAKIPDELKERLLYELTPGRSPNPTDKLIEGKKIVDDYLQSRQQSEEDIASRKGAISSAEDLGLLAMLFRGRKNNQPDDTVFTKLLDKHLAPTQHADRAASKQSAGAAIGG
jgi:hypothetical protein